MPNDLLKLTLPEQIYQILRSDILKQEIVCGSKLTLHALKDRFGVSHTPIREALTRLVEDELVDYYSNVGITVISLTRKDVEEVFKLSYDFDKLAIKYALENENKDEFLTALHENIVTCNKLIDAGEIETWQPLSDAFHLTFYKYADNSRLDRASYRLRAQLTLIYNMNKLEEQNYKHIQKYHDIIYNELSAENMDGAVDALKNHIYEDMLLALDRMEQ